MNKKIGSIEKVTEDLQRHGRAAMETDKEILRFARARDNYVQVTSRIYPKSISELEQYRTTSLKRLASLPGGYRRHHAAITLKKMMPMTRVDEIQSTAGLDVFGIKIQGTHGFITMSKYPIDVSWITEAEEVTRKNMIETETLEEGERFSLIEGVVAVYVNATHDALEKLLDEDDIYLIDVGPQEHMDNLAVVSAGTEHEWKPVLGPLLDIAHYINKHSNTE